MPRRYLIDVPGGEEEFAPARVTDLTRSPEGNLHLLLNVMDKSIQSGNAIPYVELFEHMREIEPNLQFPPRIVVWMGDYRLSRDFSEDDLIRMFGETVDEMFSLTAAREAKKWIMERASLPRNEGFLGIGMGAIVSLGYIADPKEVSTSIRKWQEQDERREWRAPLISPKTGIVGIHNSMTRAAVYKLFMTHNDFLPLAGHGLDIGEFSVGKYTHTSDWYWNVNPLTPFEREMVDEMFYGPGEEAERVSEEGFPEPDLPEPDLDDEPIMLSRDGWIDNFSDLLPRFNSRRLREVYGKISEYLENYPGDLPRNIAELPAVLPPHVPGSVSTQWVRTAFTGLHTDDMEDVFNFAWQLQRTVGLSEAQRRELNVEGWVEEIVEMLPGFATPHIRVLYDLAVTYITHQHPARPSLFDELPITLGGGTSREDAYRYLHEALGYLDEDDLENIYDTALGYFNPEV